MSKKKPTQPVTIDPQVVEKSEARELMKRTLNRVRPKIPRDGVRDLGGLSFLGLAAVSDFLDGRITRTEFGVIDRGVRTQVEIARGQFHYGSGTTSYRLPEPGDDIAALAPPAPKCWCPGLDWCVEATEGERCKSAPTE